MNTNELREHIRHLNDLEKKKQDLRREFALKRIKELREAQKREKVIDHN